MSKVQEIKKEIMGLGNALAEHRDKVNSEIIDLIIDYPNKLNKNNDIFDPSVLKDITDTPKIEWVSVFNQPNKSLQSGWINSEDEFKEIFYVKADGSCYFVQEDGKEVFVGKRNDLATKKEESVELEFDYQDIDNCLENFCWELPTWDIKDIKSFKWVDIPDASATPKPPFNTHLMTFEVPEPGEPECYVNGEKVSNPPYTNNYNKFGGVDISELFTKQQMTAPTKLPFNYVNTPADPTGRSTCSLCGTKLITKQLFTSEYKECPNCQK